VAGINHLVLGIALETSPPSLDADVEIAGKQMAGTIGLAINANTGIPTNLVWNCRARRRGGRTTSSSSTRYSTRSAVSGWATRSP